MTVEPTIERLTEVQVTALQDMPAVRLIRDFQGTPAQVLRAHTDPELFARWVGPNDTEVEVDHWDARTGGSWRYVSRAGEQDFAFHGCFHEVGETRLVQTFTFEGFPESVLLEIMTLTDLGDGWTRMEAVSMYDSYASRDGMVASGMEVGLSQGYAKLDGLLRGGDLAD